MSPLLKAKIQISAMTAAFLFILWALAQMIFPQLVSLYYLAAHYQEISVAILMLVAVLAAFKLILAEL